MKIDCSQLESRIFPDKEILLHQNGFGKEAYLIQEGTVRVSLERDGRVIDLAILGPGQIIGEISLLTGEKNTASVEAIGEVTVSVITEQIIDKKLSTTDPLILELVKMLIERVRSTNEALLESETREFIEIDLI